MYYRPGRVDSRQSVTRALADAPHPCHTNSVNQRKTMRITYELSHVSDSDTYESLDVARDVAFDISLESGETIFIYECFGASMNKIEEVTA